MALLVDLFGYLGVVIHGCVIVAQSVAIGSVVFLLVVARPLAPRIGPEGPGLAASVARVGAWSAFGLVAAEGLYLTLQLAVLLGTTDLSVGQALGASFALAGLAKLTASGALAVLLLGRGLEAPPWALAGLAAVVLVASTLGTHAAARVDGRASLLALELLHQAGAAIWIGGIPVFVLALARLRGAVAWRLAGARFSRLSMLGVALLLASGIGMSVAYIGDLPGFYGTAFGLMVAAKIAMFAMLLALGLGNLLVVERLRASPAGPSPGLRMRRFAEAEIGIGFTLMFAAASLTSVPPAADLTTDRLSWAEIVERNTPRMPRLVSPDHDALAISTLQAELDREAAAKRVAPALAYTPGSSAPPPRNAADIAWSEYNHHVAGFFVLAIGMMALLAQAGWRPARHWPLLFLGLGAFLLVRADPDAWPLGRQSFGESFRDVETLQHRTFLALIVAFALFEWRVRVRDLRTGWMPLVFPLVSAAGAALLLTHQHAISNVKEQLLIELSHTPLALAGLVAGWARWLELRLDPDRDARLRTIAAWTWPVCFLVVGLILLVYRES